MMHIRVKKENTKTGILITCQGRKEEDSGWNGGCRWASGMVAEVNFLTYWWLHRGLPWNNSLNHTCVVFCICVLLQILFFKYIY